MAARRHEPSETAPDLGFRGEAMIYRHIRVSGRGDAHRWTLAAEQGPDRALDDITPELNAAASAGEKLVVLWGHDPAARADLSAVLSACREAGVSPSLRGLAHLFDPAELRRLRAEIAWLPLHGDAQTHDSLVEREGAWQETIDWLHARSRPRVRIEMRLTSQTLPHVKAVAEQAAAHAEALVFHGAIEDPLPVEALREALAVAWEVTRGTQLEIFLHGVSCPPDGCIGPSRPLDQRLLDIRLQGGWLPGLHGGVHTAPPHQQRLLHALGLLPDQAPLPARPITPPVVVVVPPIQDTLLATSTLPGLAHHLQAAGIDTRVDSVWHRPWNLFAPQDTEHQGVLVPAAPSQDAQQSRERVETAHRFGSTFMEHLDLSGAKTIVVPGWSHGAAVLANPTRAHDAQVIVLDLHLMDGVHAMLDMSKRSERAVDDSWWPTEDLTVWSCFPGYAANYHRHGIPISHVRWRPYPIYRGHFGEGPPTGTCTHIATAGNHRRDGALLTRVAELLDGQVHPMWLHTSQPLDDIGPLRFKGQVSLQELHETVRTSRFVVLPLTWSPHDAAGITLASMALAAGRPIVASRTWAMVDHIIEGVSGLLVEPGDAHALADAIRTLDGNPALLEELSAGSSRAGRSVSTESWASLLISGACGDWPIRPR